MIERVFGKEGRQLVDGSGAGEDASVRVNEMVTNAGECLVKCVHVEGFALLVEISGPLVVGELICLAGGLPLRGVCARGPHVAKADNE